MSLLAELEQRNLVRREPPGVVPRHADRVTPPKARHVKSQVKP